MTKVQKSTLCGFVLAIAGAFALVGYLVSAMKQYTAPAPLNEARIAERSKALAEIRAATETELSSYGKIDAAKGVYRLKVSQAMALTEELYKNPEAARKTLVDRAEKANFVPPPPKFE
ncbi:MAG TPA: hypothetical protein DCM86_14110 [Verrucomicrobiales bacterium]|nr:hypothetical protein [Verrucomicrobiales bacterium]